jgi:hypothetical protein
MEKTNIRVATDYAVTRRQKRFIAKIKMKAAGLKKICKHDYTTLYFYKKPVGTERHDSKFATEWRNYVEGV